MKRFLRFVKTNLIPLAIAAVVLLILFAHSNTAKAFNNNNGRNLPFCDTTMTPSWDPPGVWYEWCGRRWFVPDNGPQKASGTSYKLSRTFFEKKDRREQAAAALQNLKTTQLEKFNRLRSLKKPSHTSAVEITLEDMQKNYQIGSDFLEYYATPETTTMDMGVFDPNLETPQHWVMPAGLEFAPLVKKILDPKATPYPDLAPNATHCLYFQSPTPNSDEYQYYLLDQDGLYLEGEANQHYNYTDNEESEIMPLPLDANTVYYSGYGETADWTANGDTTWYSSTEYGVDVWYYMSEAYGTLQTIDDGPVDVIKIAYQWWWLDYQVNPTSTDGKDNLIDFANGTEIYFYSKDGHQFMISIDSLGVETTGIVKPDMVYYQKVRKASSVDGGQSAFNPGFQVFPNPTSGMVHFNKPTGFELFDVLGRRVMFEKNASQANLSHLPRGMYFIKPDKGLTRKLLINK
jgi:hypothetical protein